jgi:hypothetical protein
MAKARQKRGSRGAPWYRKYDDCWYVTVTGQRHKLTDLDGQPIRGKGSRQGALDAAARVRLNVQPVKPPTAAGDWTVAKVCEVYLEKAQRENSREHYRNARGYLNDLVSYCGALTVAEMDIPTIERWIGRHKGWKSQNTVKTVMGIVVAAFAYAHKRYEKRGWMMSHS